MYHNNELSDNYSFEHVTPNSRIVPPMTSQNNVKNKGGWRQPARTTSLQRQEHYFERESFIDPTVQYPYYSAPSDTYTDDDNLIKDIYSQTKDIQSNVQRVIRSPIQVQHGFVDLPQPSVAIIENNINSAKLVRKQPPLPPLVIPPTSTPTRTSSISKNSLPIGQSTPGGVNTPNGSSTPCDLSTPGSSRQDSPYTPQNHQHMIPSPLGGAKKQSLLPDSKAEQLLHQGIKYHEAGRLEEATQLFKQASDLNIPIAMFLYGISLRHGWGCTKNEFLAFQYLQKAAEHAVEDLTSLSSTVNMSAAKNELIMSIYELGVSFRHGWGCKKNKETAVYYFKIAADLNDPDAQNDLGHCYYHGQGVKKDLASAAKYYRLAEKQGQGIMGNSWIWKSKYD